METYIEKENIDHCYRICIYRLDDGQTFEDYGWNVLNVSKIDRGTPNDPTDDYYPENGGWEKLAWNNRAVIVTAQKGEEGVVYVVPMIQLGTGNLDASAALRYDGFGRILAVSATCY